MRLIAWDLGAERGGEMVFAGIGFELAAGQALAVTGPNGSGKTTLLRVVAGLLPAAQGAIRLDGGSEDWPTPQAAAHYLGPRNAMKDALTVGENLAFWRDFLGAARLSPDDALEAVGLNGIGHLPFAYLSTGQKRRAAMARLLVSRRPLWLLDEPTAGLDAASEKRFAALMRDHLAEGGMVLAATHIPLGIEAAELGMGAAAPC